jgi:hypothetical protein
MKCRNFPRIYLLVAGVSAAGFFAPQIAQAQITPDPLMGATQEEDALPPPVDDDLSGTESSDQTTREDHLHMSYEGTQTSTGVSALDESGAPETITEERMTIERETEIRTDAYASPPETTYTGDSTIYIDDEEDDDRFYGSGIGLEAGGGVNEFANGRVAQITESGGAWGARLTIGTRSPVALEAAYIGSANPIQTLGLDRSTLMSNGAEGALRLHLALAELNDSGSVMVKPYLLAGFAWKHYDLRGDSVNTSNVQDSDDVFEVPLGVGLNWSFGHFIADQRFDYRPSLSGSVVRDLNDDTSDENLNTWSLTARVGVEF